MLETPVTFGRLFDYLGYSTYNFFKGIVARDFFPDFFHGSTLCEAQILRLGRFYFDLLFVFAKLFEFSNESLL
jgi:hypothetical protein